VSSPSHAPPQLFALEARSSAGQRIADALQRPLSDHLERAFDDGEHKTRPLVSVRGRDVFVIHSLYADDAQSVNDKLCRLLFFLGALNDAAPERVTAVVPYLCYARKDRQTKPRDPVTTRYVARLFEAVGVDRVVTMDVHNLAAYQNAFRCATEHLEARGLFINHFAGRLDGQDVAVVSPDVGGIKRVEHFREGLSAVLGRDVPMAYVEKKRSGGTVTGGTLVGDIAGRVAIILDDLISTGTTIAQAATACQRGGAEVVYAAATHGVFAGDAAEKLALDALDGLVVADTIPPFRLEGTPVHSKIEVLSTVGLFAEAIQRMHTGGSLADLMSI
jgi:ribose-phosphate pyrophosphokinase